MQILTLTTWQQRRRERQLRSATDARVYRRTLALPEVGGGEAVEAVAARLGVTARVIYRWVGIFARSHDPAALRDRDRPGRPRRLMDRGREVLGELLGRSPQDLGGYAAAWTVPLLGSGPITAWAYRSGMNSPTASMAPTPTACLRCGGGHLVRNGVNECGSQTIPLHAE